MKKLITFILVAFALSATAGTGEPVNKPKELSSETYQNIVSVKAAMKRSAANIPPVNQWKKLPGKKPANFIPGTEKRYETEWVCETTQGMGGIGFTECSCMTLYSTVVWGQTIWYALCSPSAQCGQLPRPGGLPSFDVGCPYAG